MTAARCGSCNAKIAWATSAKGLPMPIDVTPTPAGGLYLIEQAEGPPLALHANSRDARLTTEARISPMFTSHFATCPNAAAHRSPRANGRGAGRE